MNSLFIYQSIRRVNTQNNYSLFIYQSVRRVNTQNNYSLFIYQSVRRVNTQNNYSLFIYQSLRRVNTQNNYSLFIYQSVRRVNTQNNYSLFIYQLVRRVTTQNNYSLFIYQSVRRVNTQKQLQSLIFILITAKLNIKPTASLCKDNNFSRLQNDSRAVWNSSSSTTWDWAQLPVPTQSDALDRPPSFLCPGCFHSNVLPLYHLCFRICLHYVHSEAKFILAVESKIRSFFLLCSSVTSRSLSTPFRHHDTFRNWFYCDVMCAYDFMIAFTCWNFSIYL